MKKILLTILIMTMSANADIQICKSKYYDFMGQMTLVVIAHKNHDRYEAKAQARTALRYGTVAMFNCNGHEPILDEIERNMNNLGTIINN